eukprot:982924-Rhodomonas_salina.1
MTWEVVCRHCLREAKAGTLVIHSSLPRADHLAGAPPPPPLLFAPMFSSPSPCPNPPRPPPPHTHTCSSLQLKRAESLGVRARCASAGQQRRVDLPSVFQRPLRGPRVLLVRPRPRPHVRSSARARFRAWN